MPLERVTTLESFLELNHPRFIVSDSWLISSVHEELGTIITWGRPTEESAQELVHALGEVLARPERHPHKLLVDFSRLEMVSPSVFRVLYQYFQRRQRLMGRLRLKKALIRPEGILGATVAGFWSLFEVPHEAKHFTVLAEGLEWLGEEGALVAHRELEAAIPQIFSDELIGALRQYLVRHPSSNLPQIARALHVSTRTLQRHLKRQGTSLRRELNDIRVARATELLRWSDAKIMAIAHELGFGSAQGMIAWFRDQFGVAPATWRKAVRGEVDDDATISAEDAL